MKRNEFEVSFGRLGAIRTALKISENGDTDNGHVTQKTLFGVDTPPSVDDVDEAEDWRVIASVRLPLVEVDQIFGTVVRTQLVRAQARASRVTQTLKKKQLP